MDKLFIVLSDHNGGKLIGAESSQEQAIETIVRLVRESGELRDGDLITVWALPVAAVN